MSDPLKSLCSQSARWGGAILVCAALLFMFLDRPLAWAAYGLKETWVHSWAGYLSLLADHTVIFAFCATGLAICALNAARGRAGKRTSDLLYVCLAVCAAVAFVESIKFVFGRRRPELLFTQAQYGFTWFTDVYVRNSFPSGHTTRIFALMTAGALVFRRLTVPLIGLAAVVGLSRVLALKHYPSDVLVGAFLGGLVAFWAYAMRDSSNSGR